MAKKHQNPDPLSTVLLSSAVGGAAMQVGAAIAGKFLDKDDKKKKSNPGVGLSSADVRKLKTKLLR